MANVFDQFDAPAPASTAPPAARGNVFDQFDEAPAPRGPATFAERFDAAPPMSRADAAPKVPAGAGQAFGGEQGSADRLFVGMRRTADEALVGKPSLENQVDAGLFRFADAAGLNVPRNLMAGAESLRTGKPFRESYEYVKDTEDALARQYPKTALGGTVGGVVGGAVALPAFRAAEGAGLAGRGLANFGTGAAYAGAAQFADTKDLTDTAIAGGAGGVLGGVGGALIDKAAPVVSRLFARNMPFRGADGALTDEASAALREAGIDPGAITPALAQHIETVFAAKGATPAAAREAQAASEGIGLSRGQATGDQRALDMEARAMAGRSGPRAQGVARDFADRQAGEISAVGDRLQGMAAGDFGRVASPTAAYEAVAERARQAAAGQVEQVSVAQRGVDDALRAVRGRGGTDAINGAESAISGLREAAGQAKAGYRAAYDEVAAYPHQFAPGALDRMGARVRDRLGADVPLDDRLTPAAMSAISDLDNVPGIFGLAPGEGPNLQQVDQLRKRLGAYYRATGQNPTDRRAVGRIMDELDGHLQDAAAAGLLNRPAPRSPELPADGFPGMAGPTAGSAPLPAAGGAPGVSAGQPETLTRFLARGGGVPHDAEARAADLHRLYVPGEGTLARHDAPSWDQIRVRLAEEGFLPPGMDGAASARDVADWARSAIHAERTGGRPTVRMQDEARVGGQRAADAVSDQNGDHLAMVDRQARRMAIDLEGYGLRPQDLDRAALNDAAERMVLGHHADAGDAYEAALAAREAVGAGRGGQPAHEVPFDGPTSVAASDALPIGDTAPLDAMQKARGLFREYSQAFKPRGPGDVAGQRLQRILERDASPNEVVGMLFGSPGTGKVTGGQIQTLARVRAAVGADSDAWRATQQALVARHLGGEGRDLGTRLDYLLRGEGRGLTSFLTEGQRAGLGQLRAAVARAEAAGVPAPTWANDLERSGFDPNRIAHGLFGGSEMAARVGAAQEARAAKAFLGEGSAEWSGVRQAAILRLMSGGEGAGGGGRFADQARAFTDGSGKGVAGALFSPEELGQIRRAAAAVRMTLTPEGSIRPDAGARLDAVKLAFDRLSHMVALHLGGIPGAVASIGAARGREMVAGRFAAGRARWSFEGGAPRALEAPPLLPLGQLASGEGLAIGQR